MSRVSDDPEIQAQSTKALTNLLERMGTQNWKVAKDTFEQVGKIKKEQWMEMKNSFTEIVNIMDRGGFGGLLGDSINRLEGQISNSLEAAFAPLTNIIAKALDSVFDVPAVQNIVGGVTTLFHRGMMLLTGDMEGLRNELIRHQQEVEQIRRETGASGYELYKARTYLEMKGIDWQALNEQGTAGGVYSGQFDIDLDYLKEYLSNITY